MLFCIKRHNKHGVNITRIVHSEETLSSYKNMDITRFKYKHDHPVYPPLFFVDKNGDKYLVPSWIKVHPKTTKDDIEWKPKTFPKPKTWKFESSSSPGLIYVVKKVGDKITCNCSGFWRSKGNCKHVKSVKKGLDI